MKLLFCCLYQPTTVYLNKSQSWIVYNPCRFLKTIAIFIQLIAPWETFIIDKCVFLKWFVLITAVSISIDAALRWMAWDDRTNDKSTFVRIMVWCRQAVSHYLNQCRLRFITSLGPITHQGPIKKSLYVWPCTKALQPTFIYSRWKCWRVNVASQSHYSSEFCISFIAQNRIILVVVNQNLQNLSSHLTTEFHVQVLIRIVRHSVSSSPSPSPSPSPWAWARAEIERQYRHQHQHQHHHHHHHHHHHESSLMNRKLVNMTYGTNYNPDIPEINLHCLCLCIPYISRRESQSTKFIIISHRRTLSSSTN